jgi:hypothetical protein
MGPFHSRFGGLWIDNTDAGAVITRLAKIDDPGLRDAVAQLSREGYAIIESAVEPTAIDAYLREYEAAATISSFM